MSTISLRPNADGDVLDFLITPATPTTHYDKVDEATSDDDTTKIRTTTLDVAQKDLYHIPDPSGFSEVIDSVAVYYYSKQRSAEMRPLIKIGGTEYTGNVSSGNADWATNLHTWTTNPNSGVAWTWANINALQIGMYGYLVSASPTPRYWDVTMVWALVTFGTSPPYSFIPRVFIY